MYQLNGFSTRSGLRMSTPFQNAPENQSLPSLYQATKKGISSEFTICLRFKTHFRRPEYVLFAAYVANRTAIQIGKLRREKLDD